MNDHVELFVRVDNRAFTLQDERATWNGVWTNRTVLQDGIGLAPGVISVADATRGRGEAPVLVELVDGPPDDDVDDYDGVVEAPLEAPSGKLRFVSGTEVIPIGTVTPGSYRVRVYYGNADAADFDGDKRRCRPLSDRGMARAARRCDRAGFARAHAALRCVGVEVLRSPDEARSSSRGLTTRGSNT